MIEVRVPDIGDFDEVDVVEVLVEPGRRVEAEESLITLESEKASMDVPAPVAGVVREVSVKVGDKVGEGALIVKIEEAEQGEADAETEAKPAESKKAAEAQPAKKREAEERRERKPEPEEGEAEEPEEDEGGAEEAAAGDQEEEEEEDEESEEEAEPARKPRVARAGVERAEKPAPAGRGEEAPARSRPAPAAVDGGDGTEGASDEESDAAPTRQPKTPPPPPPQPAPDDGPPTYASPSVRRFARELGVDLRQLQGSGPKGRIVREDVQSFVKSAMAAPRREARGAAAAPEAGGAQPAGAGIPPVPAVDFSKFGPIEEKTLSRIRLRAKENLHRSWLNVVHVTQHDTADVTEMEAFRKANAAEAEQRGFKLTPLAFVMKAAVATLQEFPRVNSALAPSGDKLIYRNYWHLGIAVDTEDGLVVPVIRDVDRKGIYELAQELAEVSGRAREKKLGLGEVTGATFTITSLGGIGGTAFTPIVNAPEVAILGVSRSRMEPVWRDGQFVPRLMLPLSLSYDHRVVDGAEAVRFTTYLAGVLGDIRRLLL